MDYDLCVIGAGWAGFNAAISAARSGKKVCCIEEKEIGGTCLNRGCIPTKAWVAFSKQGLPLAEIQRKKNEVIERLRKGMSYALASHKIDFISGKARIEAPDRVCVNGESKISARFILIATGSVPKDLPQLKFDHQKVISSDDVLDMEALPKKVLIIGAGAIGCEFASILRRLGSDVTLIEICPQLLPGMDTGLSKKLQQAFAKSGITVELNKGCEGLRLDDFDKVLLSVGRGPRVDGLFSEDFGIRLEKGAVCVDRELKTGISNIFAAGDCIGGYMLAHVASYEGELASANMFSKATNRDYSVIPSSVFSSPEVASVGVSEEEAKQSGAAYKAVSVNFLSIGMAHILDETDGFIKIISDKKTGAILGADTCRQARGRAGP